MRKRIPTEGRYWARVDRSGGPDSCWPWTGARNRDGYGTFWDGTYRPDGRPHNVGAHRWGCEQTLGRQLASDECVCHRCDNPCCQNPAHWFVGSHSDNAVDRTRKGRGFAGGIPSRGTANGSAKLSEDQVRDIRRANAAGESQGRLARRFGVSQPLVNAIVNRKLWQHI